MKQKNEESKNKFKKGFTLIELLVVVLIIGILAGIALPQYKKTVEKVHFNNAVSRIEALKKQIELYFLQQGGFPSSKVSFLGDRNNLVLDYTWADLDVDFTAGLNCDTDGGNNHCQDGHYFYGAVAGPWGYEMYASKMSPSGACCSMPDIRIYRNGDYFSKRCETMGDPLAKSLCKSLPPDWEVSDW